MKNINDVGFYFDNFFEKDNIFEEIVNAHEFQSLTESNKNSSAYRKGIYITNVENVEDYTKFNLLRCSTNFVGPTDNIRDIDKYIIDKVNDIRTELYPDTVELNHVLAQIYYNQIVNNKEKKAKIKEHSDKTKDMPLNCVMAFCTFYIDLKNDLDESFTILRFKLKDCVKNDKYIKKFDIILQPNSLFIMPISTNRLYTHEIIPPKLNNHRLPTRMGYVIRSSKTEAIHKNYETFIKEDLKEDINLVKLNVLTNDNINELRELYLLENMTDEIVNYPHIYYSMNNGDYLQPLI